REVEAIPGVRNFGAHFGRAVLGDQPVGINSATLWVSVDPSANYDATVAAVRQTLDGYPGVVHRVQTYTEESLRQVLTGSNDDMVVRLYGPDWPTLRRKAEDVRRAISGIAGVVGLHTERLADVADTRIAPALTSIHRESISDRIDVGFNVRGRDLGSVARDVRHALLSVEFPLEHRAVLLGEFEQRQEARQRTLIAAGVA